MLKSLSIKNYALIDKAVIEFGSGFTVITGETGAGKSIMLGALGLVLGQRSDVSVIGDKESKCVIESVFDVSKYGLRVFFEEEDVDYEEETVLRREILPSGKSRAFVNDTPVNLNFLKSLSDKLIDVHSQHQNLLLGDNHFQLNVVDTVASNNQIVEGYREAYHKYRKLLSDKKKLEELNARQRNDQDYWEFQFKQLEEANLQAGEQAELERELETLAHVEEIKSALSQAALALYESEQPMVQELFHLKETLQRISSYLPQGDELSDRMNSVYIELKDIAEEITERGTEVEFDPGRQQLIQERLDMIYSLQQKHHVDSVEALLEIREDLSSKLEQLASFDEELVRVDKEIASALNILQDLSKSLTKSREKVFKQIENFIQGQLRELGMPNARFSVSNKKNADFGPEGQDEIAFLFSANKSAQLTDIPKVASGGEISRVMLCIKSLLSDAKGLPTIIFDEIDTGVSGEIADRMGRIMQLMGKNIQVISITHLPQIAGKGNRHFKVFKTETDHQTISSVKLLSNDERVNEIAGMLSGSSVTDAALENARFLMEN
ncbi:DNA repair protein RecN [Marinilabilia salmonicolor]|jgi:DNA repair protein RecN (Recombination protein N)|uniref:DNA repair protein RecN n=1 Tax=Marinilabilia salmonicolor TaxID=989 RepID=A0A368UQF8_9BACT|nr:DNA repair protein RecN [Marinilabilia salmonicolor]RCW31039.1 DNA replication and repair protein RecN [Marinilabilia salmonicolor]